MRLGASVATRVIENDLSGIFSAQMIGEFRYVKAYPFVHFLI